MTCTALAVSKLVRDVEFVFRTNRHQLQTFGPTFDDAVERELDRLAALVAAVKNSTVNQRTLIVYLNGRFSGRLRTLTFRDDLVLQTTVRGLYLCAQRILLQEFLTCCLGLAVFERSDNAFYIRTGRLQIELLGIIIQTVDETLLDAVEIGLQTFDAQQTYRFLLTDRLTDILCQTYDLRIAHFLLHTGIHIVDELINSIVAAVSQQISLDLRTVQQTEGIIERVGHVFQLHRLGALRALSADSLTGLTFRACLVGLHKEGLRCVRVHHRRVVEEGVHHTLQVQFAVECPCRVLCQTVLLKALHRNTELTTGLSDLTQLLVLVLISFLQCVDEFCYSLIAAVVSHVVLLDLQTVEQTYCVVDRVTLVAQFSILCFVTVAARNHHQCS